MYQVLSLKLPYGCYITILRFEIACGASAATAWNWQLPFLFEDDSPSVFPGLHALPFCLSPRLSSFLLPLRAVGTMLGLAKQFYSSRPCSLVPENGNGDCAVVLAELVGEGWEQLEWESHHCSSVPEGIKWISLCAWVVSNDRCLSPCLESSISGPTVSQMCKALPHRTIWQTVRARHGAVLFLQANGVCHASYSLLWSCPPAPPWWFCFIQSLELCFFLRSNLIHNQADLLAVFCHSTADDAHICTCAVCAYWASVFQPHCLSVSCVVLATWKLMNNFWLSSALLGQVVI